MTNSDTTGNLFNILERCRTSRYSGMIHVHADERELSVWFVRGNLAHAENPEGETGWKALESLKGRQPISVTELADELPPQRTIRVDTVRLLRAMKVFEAEKKSAKMHVPVPFHVRLQKKFTELKQKVSGLQSFEIRRLMESGTLSDSAQTGERESGVGPGDSRTIIEKDPRGSRWTQQYGNRQLRIIGDESLSTTELMWVGSELWQELEKLKGSASDDES
jgi:hypothetical protein